MERKYLTLKEIQKEEVKIAREIDQFCENHNLKYYLASGSLIGAVRHHGFIPWDDDMDLIMIRKDFETFCETFESKDLIVKYCENSSLHAPFAKVCNTRIAVECEDLGDEDNSLLWVDIFPIDAIKPNSFIDKIKTAYVRRLMRDIALNRLEYVPKKNPFLNLIGLIEHKYCSKLTTDKIVKKSRVISNISKQNKQFTSGFLGFRPDKFYWPEEIFMTRRKYQFEDTQLFSVEDYDLCLRVHYGDYMKLPPESQRYCHHMKAYYIR